MNYHILHQFDEQWFADSGQKDDASSRPYSFFRTRTNPGNGPQNSRTKTLPRTWLIVGASLIVAACALYLAIDARRQTIQLQQRLTDVESRLKK